MRKIIEIVRAIAEFLSMVARWLTFREPQTGEPDTGNNQTDENNENNRTDNNDETH